MAVLVAMRGLGNVAPNPLVGSVIVDREHRFLAAGAHEQVGSHHAEINAFVAFDRLKVTTPEADATDGTLYVTLEPCAHANRTPACAAQLAPRGIKRVIFGTVDPNPAVNGRGAAILAAAGVSAEHDASWQDACEELAEVFLWNMRFKMPFVALKAATSLDGAIARPGDQRAWITGARARAYGHFLRLHYDANMVGQRTLIADNPTLDTRDSLVKGRAPIRVVIDPDGAALKSRDPKTWKLLGKDPERVFWIHRDDLVASDATKKLDDTGVVRIPITPTGEGFLDAKSILAQLADRHVTSVLLEGGAGLYGPFLAAGLVRRLHLFQGAQVFGGSQSLNWTAQAGTLTLKSASATHITPLGDDWLVETTLKPEG